MSNESLKIYPYVKNTKYLRRTIADSGTNDRKIEITNQMKRMISIYT